MTRYAGRPASRRSRKRSTGRPGLSAYPGAGRWIAAIKSGRREGGRHAPSDRKSSADASAVDAQLAALAAAGCDVIRREQASGTTLEARLELRTVLDFIRAGDTLVVTRIDRLARSLRDLQEIVALLKEKGAHLAATEQPIDTSTAAGKAFFDMLGVFAEFETNLRRERQAEGIAAARLRGAYKGRPPRIDRAEVRRRLDAGERPAAIAREMGISRRALHQASNAPQVGQGRGSRSVLIRSQPAAGPGRLRAAAHTRISDRVDQSASRRFVSAKKRLSPA